MICTETRKIPSVEEIQATLVTPNYFFGENPHWKMSLVKNPQGSIIKSGQRYSYMRVMTGYSSCQFADKESAKDSLETTYNWWCNMHPHSRYLPFEECLKWCEPECVRENPEMHGVRLVMIPQ